MKIHKKLLAFVLAFSLILAVAPAVKVSATDTAELVPQYRMYNPQTSEHFYTMDVAERDALVQNSWRYEGVNCLLPVYSDSPVYRLCDVESGKHHYTMDANERSSLVKSGWRDEGIGWYSGGNISVYRLFNPEGTPVASHHYTSDSNEKSVLVGQGWHDEGIAWTGTSAEGYEDPNPLPVGPYTVDEYGLINSGPGATNATAAIPSRGIEPSPQSRWEVERIYQNMLKQLPGFEGSGINYLVEKGPYFDGSYLIYFSTELTKGDVIGYWSGLSDMADWYVVKDDWIVDAQSANASSYRNFISCLSQY